MTTPSAHSQANLLGLPDELLLQILTYVDCFDHAYRTTTLYGINLSNRRLYGLTKPYLYSTFSFHAGVPYLFLRTISQNLRLASCVKKVHWDYDTEAAERFSYKRGVLAVKQSFEVDEVRAILTNLKSIGDQFASCMLEDLGSTRLYLGDLKALHLLLMFAPNIQYLNVLETYRWDDHVYWFMPLGFKNPNALSQLTSATLNGPLRLQNIAALIFLPSMRRLELSQVVELRQQRDRAFMWDKPDVNKPWKTNSRSYIEYFHLKESFVDMDDLRTAVRTMRGLKSFAYEHHMNLLSHRVVRFNIKSLCELLHHQANTLASLRIVHPRNTGFISFDAEDSTLLCSALPNMTQLINLDITHAQEAAQKRMFKWQDLPPNLESLSLDFVDLWIWNADRDFTDLEQSFEALAFLKRRGDLPNLRALTLTHWHPWFGSVPPNVTCIKKMLQDAGLSFSTKPAEMGSSYFTLKDIGWVELQTEPEWVLVERYEVSSSQSGYW